MSIALECIQSDPIIIFPIWCAKTPWRSLELFYDVDILMPGVLGPLQGRSQGACGQGRGQGWSSGPKSGADAGKGTRAGKGPGVTGTGLVTFEVVKCDKHI